MFVRESFTAHIFEYYKYIRVMTFERFLHILEYILKIANVLHTNAAVYRTSVHNLQSSYLMIILDPINQIYCSLFVYEYYDV